MEEMKKQVIAYFLLLLIGAQLLVQFGYMKADAKGPTVIPKEAVQLRILANSDSDKDQALKRKVRDEVKAQIDGWVAELTSFEEARKVIQNHIPEIEKTVANTLKRRSKKAFQVKFGKNVKFLAKVYGNLIYPAGEYTVLLQLEKVKVQTGGVYYFHRCIFSQIFKWYSCKERRTCCEN